MAKMKRPGALAGANGAIENSVTNRAVFITPSSAVEGVSPTVRAQFRLIALKLPPHQARRFLAFAASPFCAALALPDAEITLAWAARWRSVWGAGR
jgi:hypothetical protein